MSHLKLAFAAKLLLPLLLAPHAQAQGVAQTAGEIECGPLTAPARVAPHDYRKDRRLLQVVEGAHFRPATEQLIKPRFLHFGGDLDYTLFAFPNHHRALVTMVKLGEREKTDRPEGLSFTVECGFKRAIRFVPDDVIVRMLYAQYLNKHQRSDEAMQQLAYVDSVAGDIEMTRRNLGLLYVELKAYDKAREQAWRSGISEGSTNPLKAQLEAAGEWREPPASPGTNPPASAPARAASSSNP